MNTPAEVTSQRSTVEIRVRRQNEMIRGRLGRPGEDRAIIAVSASGQSDENRENIVIDWITTVKVTSYTIEGQNH